MVHPLVEILTSAVPAVHHRPLAPWCRAADRVPLLVAAEELDAFRRNADNLYQRVRALLFLASIHLDHLCARRRLPARGRIPWAGHEQLLDRRFDEAIDTFLTAQREQGPNEALSSALAAAYRALAFGTLADQVRRSVRLLPSNRWMFELDDPRAHPLRLADPLRTPGAALIERTPVRMDLSHSCWSDIFFLGMDYPEGARVLNVSIDLGVRGRDDGPAPPIEATLRTLDEPVLRLTSHDLGHSADCTRIADVFDFARDHLGLLRAGLIAAGVVPPGLEQTDGPLTDVLEPLVGAGRGLQLSTHVRGIPKGSRLAVSTNLLASIIAVGMRATGQTASLQGPLEESERRLICARAILGEWLGGSGGGWQDSGGLWPSLKLIVGAPSRPEDPEYGVSRGRLLPDHTVLHPPAIAEHLLDDLAASLVLVHGGMAQDVGPVLEMVTERYLLRSETEWLARERAGGIFDAMLEALRVGDVAALGRLTHDNFFGPIETVIPWANNAYTERLVDAARARFGEGFRGFWMLGGMAGGGMGFLFDPAVQAQAKQAMATILTETKRSLEHALPFAMDPVVYDFAVNERGSVASLLAPGEPSGHGPSAPIAAPTGDGAPSLDRLLADNGFDPELHERIRTDLREGRIGLAHNRLPVSTVVEDVRPFDVIASASARGEEARDRGRRALAAGEVVVVTLAGGSGTRWTQGAGVVKACHPFVRMGGAWRSFVDIHLAKSRHAGRAAGATVPHVITTSYLTHGPLRDAAETWISRHADEGLVDLRLSRGRFVGLRLVPTERDLRFAWHETRQQVLDEQAQKVQQSLQEALIRWAREAGEASDYRDNLAHQCLHPVGHWYEIPNLLLNGTLAGLLADRPGLRTLLLHNVDTLGADLDAGLLGQHLLHGAALTFEVLPRRIEDRGGGLGRIDGELRLVESVALPREQDELALSYYNSMTTWIDIDGLLAVFSLTRPDLHDADRVAAAVRSLSERLPAYVTLKDVKKRWGHGHEDVFPVAQYEQLWSDMTALPELACRFVAVDRMRGQQLKEPAQLDPWLRDGSAAAVEALTAWR